jgi:hypothetical protein
MADVLLRRFLRRQILGNDRDSDEQEEEEDEENSCPTNHDAYSVADPIVGDVTFHELMTYISIPLTVITVILCLWLICGHIFNYREPRVQKQ